MVELDNHNTLNISNNTDVHSDDVKTRSKNRQTFSRFTSKIKLKWTLTSTISLLFALINTSVAVVLTNNILISVAVGIIAAICFITISTVVFVLLKSNPVINITRLVQYSSTALVAIILLMVGMIIMSPSSAWKADYNSNTNISTECDVSDDECTSSQSDSNDDDSTTKDGYNDGTGETQSGGDYI